jgi:hypothetical protein
MAERKAVTKEMHRRYRRARKSEKAQIIDQVCELTGWSRGHARQELAGSRPKTEPRPRTRLRVYGPEVMEPLQTVWAALGGICGKRLGPFMAEAVASLERHGELEVDPAVRTKLLSASPATLDRLLAPERKRLKIKGRSGTKPGTMLKRQIDVRTFADWDDARPGFFEADLVGHEGGNSSGDFCQSLDLTCVFSGWTALRALPNKAQRWVLEAIEDVEAQLPFPLLGLDSDNGSEFINEHLLAYCSSHQVTFTRSRPGRKNDNCYVEQKNWTVVRQAVGYLRYDTDEELEVLRELYTYLEPWVNFFQPQMHLVEKIRDGAKVIRRYDEARTPYQRLMASPEIRRRTKAGLTRTYEGLNPAELKRAIGRCQDRLVEMAKTKQNRKEVSPPRDHPWRTSFLRQRKTATRTS